MARITASGCDHLVFDARQRFLLELLLEVTAKLEQEKQAFDGTGANSPF